MLLLLNTGDLLFAVFLFVLLNLALIINLFAPFAPTVISEHLHTSVTHLGLRSMALNTEFSRLSLLLLMHILELILGPCILLVIIVCLRHSSSPTTLCIFCLSSCWSRSLAWVFYSLYWSTCLLYLSSTWALRRVTFELLFVKLVNMFLLNLALLASYRMDHVLYHTVLLAALWTYSWLQILCHFIYLSAVANPLFFR